MHPITKNYLKIVLRGFCKSPAWSQYSLSYSCWLTLTVRPLSCIISRHRCWKHQILAKFYDWFVFNLKLPVQLFFSANFFLQILCLDFQLKVGFMKLSVLGVPYQESSIYYLLNHCTANEPISSFRLIVRDFVYTQIRPNHIKNLVSLTQIFA